MNRQFDLQKEKEFGRHADVCKKMRGLGMILAKYGFIQSFAPTDAHVFLPQIVNNSHYMTTKDILESDNVFQREGKQVIHACINCGTIMEDYISKK